VVSAEADPLLAVRVVSVGNRPRASWAAGLRVRLPASLLERNGWKRALAPNGDLEIPSDPSSITADDIARLRERRAFTDVPPASARLPVNYRVVPGWMRAVVASAIGRRNRGHADRWAAFPQWPIDLSADLLEDLSDAPHQTTPASRTLVIVTHDVDSPEGLTNLVTHFLPLEESVGARSTSYIVPCAWRLDEALVAEIVARGHDVGVHGYDHSHTTPFAAILPRVTRRLDIARRPCCVRGHCFATSALASATTAASRPPAGCFRRRTTAVRRPGRFVSKTSLSCRSRSLVMARSDFLVTARTRSSGSGSTVRS
jgi:hypothetical protein